MKTQVVVLCGGLSAEHEVSVLSARNVVSGLDTAKYQVKVIYISQQGKWFLIEDPQQFLSSNWHELMQQIKQHEIMLRPGDAKSPFVLFSDPAKVISVDCVLPILHGTFGEDGAVQGLLEALKVPYVGAGVCSSAIAMEKHIAKQLLHVAGLPIVDWLVIDAYEACPTYDDVCAKLGSPFFVKPSALGSSVGINKVDSAEKYQHALNSAFKYCERVIMEEYVKCREIECSVLGNEKPVASLPGEIISHHDFYSYEAKYLDPNGATTVAPADLSEEQINEIQAYAVTAFKTLQCNGMARVDFFVTESQIYINELNTIPGFTDISMYPKMWQASGLAYSDLLDKLIQLALVKHKAKQTLSHQHIADDQLNLDPMRNDQRL